MVAAAPVRLVVRALTEFALSSTVALARPHDGDLLEALAFHTIVLTVLPAEGAAAPAERRVSINALSRSLSLPYESVRGRVARLAGAGLCEVTREGVRMSAEALLRPELQAAQAEVYAAFLNALARLRAVGFALEAVAEGAAEAGEVAPDPPTPAVVVRMVLELQLRFMDGFSQTFGDLTRGLVWSAVLHANTRGLATRPELAWRYAAQDAPPPDALREPVTIRALSRELNLPFETVRRHVRTLADRGLLTADRTGAVVPLAVVTGDAVRVQNPAVMAQFVRLLGRLHRAGFDFAALEPAAAQEVSTSSRVVV